MAGLRSRRFGVYSTDKPARRARGVALTELNVLGMGFLAERGPDKTYEVESFDQFEKIFGDYSTAFYGKYAARGFFQNLKGVLGRIKARRFVASDAVTASESIPHGPGALSSVITLLNEIRTDYEAHRVLTTGTVHAVADSVNAVSAPAAIDRASAIALANDLKAKYNAHIIRTTSATHLAADTTNGVTADDATDLATLITLANSLKAKYNAHRVLLTAHTIADSTNAVSSADAAYPGSPTLKMKLSAGYLGELDPGAHGNKLAYKIVPTNRYVTKLTASAASGQKDIQVVSVSSIEIGEYIYLKKADGSAIEGCKVTAKNESTQIVTVETNLTNSYVADDELGTLNFDLYIYRKLRSGVVELREQWKYLTVAPNTERYYVDRLNNAVSGSKEVVAEDLAPNVVTNILQLNPYEQNTTTYFTTVTGSDGTSPVNNDWVNFLQKFNDELDIRYLCIPETNSSVVNKALISYAKERGDAIALPVVAEDQTFEELKSTGQNYQVSTDSYGMVNADWILVDDPIGIGADPQKSVPNVGHLAGYFMYRINKDGYQRVPAGPQEAIEGVLGVKGTVIKSDTDRTVLGDLGVNLIQFVPGAGYCLRNARMASSDPAYIWFNQIFMRIVYKKTFEESFKNLENEISGATLLRTIHAAINTFMRQDYDGAPRTGSKSAFFRYNQGGQDSKFEDVVEIIVDDSNNAIADLLKGQVNAEIYFTPPPPAESIEIGVGIKIDVGIR